MNVESLNLEQINRLNKIAMEKTHEDFKIFRRDVQSGICPMCGERLLVFNEKKPCMHWLLMPKGFRKKHFHLIYENFGLFQIDSFLRWLVHIEAPFHNINDISEEKGNNKIIETTIKYKKLEWSISCSVGDLHGHNNYGPHYHFQMRINQLPFIDYTQFHIPLNENDLAGVSVLQGKVDKVKYINVFGMGVEEAMDNLNPKELLREMKLSNEPEKSTFSMTTFLEAAPGELISGDDLGRIIKKSKETGVPFASLAGEIKNIKVNTIITPGEGIPKKASRKARKSR